MANTETSKRKKIKDLLSSIVSPYTLLCATSDDAKLTAMRVLAETFSGMTKLAGTRCYVEIIDNVRKEKEGR